MPVGGRGGRLPARSVAIFGASPSRCSGEPRGTHDGQRMSRSRRQHVRRWNLKELERIHVQFTGVMFFNPPLIPRRCRWRTPIRHSASEFTATVTFSDFIRNALRHLEERTPRERDKIHHCCLCAVLSTGRVLRRRIPRSRFKWKGFV